MELLGICLGYAALVWEWLMDHLIYINLILSVIIVFFQRRDPKAVWTWLLALYFIPIFGFLFYLIFCQDYRKSRMFRVKEVEDRLNISIKNQEDFIKKYDLTLSDPLNRDYEDLVLYNLETSGAVLTVNNEVEIFTDGEKKFTDLRQEMRNARRYIHIQYYIIKNDELFDSIIPILLEKIKEGVEVRILYDGMGGRFMPEKKWRVLKEAGVKIGEFFPAFLGRLQLRVNYRNHRKIVVIDGTVGYVGGFNIGKEYIGKDPKFGYWRDTHLRLKGDSVISLQIRFALDWNYATGENLFTNANYFGVLNSLEEEEEAWQEYEALEEERQKKKLVDLDDPGTYREAEDHELHEDWETDIWEPVGIQIVTSGPDTGSREVRNNYLELFHKAKDHIYIQTPYFVPDDAILSALKIAAQSGIDVRLMIPCMPDHPFVYWATYSYAGELVAVGAKCYIYENGFLHAKGVTVDGRVCCYGTANMDIRSFELNFEVNAVIYDEKTTKKMEDIFREDLNQCRELTKESYAVRPLWIRLKEQCCRLLSPLL